MKYMLALLCTLILVACTSKTKDKPIESGAVIEFRAASFSLKQGYTEMSPRCLIPSEDSRVYVQKVYVSEKVLLSNADIASAEVATRDGEIIGLQVGLIMTESGKTKLAQITEQGLEKPIAILVNKQLFGAPVVVEKVTIGKVMITCIATEEAEHMALQIIGKKL